MVRTTPRERSEGRRPRVLLRLLPGSSLALRLHATGSLPFAAFLGSLSWPRCPGARDGAAAGAAAALDHGAGRR